MSLDQRETTGIHDFNEEIFIEKALSEIVYCAGQRCTAATTIIGDIRTEMHGRNHEYSPHELRIEIHKRVGRHCLSECREDGLEPLGTDIDKEQIDAILEGRAV